MLSEDWRLWESNDTQMSNGVSSLPFTERPETKPLINRSRGLKCRTEYSWICYLPSLPIKDSRVKPWRHRRTSILTNKGRVVKSPMPYDVTATLTGLRRPEQGLDSNWRASVPGSQLNIFEACGPDLDFGLTGIATRCRLRS